METMDPRVRAIQLTLDRIADSRRRLSREQVEAAADGVALAQELLARGNVDAALKAARAAEAAVEGAVLV